MQITSIVMANKSGISILPADKRYIEKQLQLVNEYKGAWVLFKQDKISRQMNWIIYWKFIAASWMA
jgi:hypothetical protein